MKVELEKTFALTAPADKAWALLQNIEGVASCMPGASITERIDAQRYKGNVAVKFGPASMAFRGEVEVKALEPASMTLRLAGKGTDTTGSSGAAMDLTARVEAIDASSCNLIGSSVLSVSGKAAAFGGRMMNSVADQVLKQFAANFALQVQALQAQAPAGAADAAGSGAAEHAVGSVAATPSAGSQATAHAPRPLNAVALIWAIFRDWLRSLFAHKRA